METQETKTLRMTLISIITGRMTRQEVDLQMKNRGKNHHNKKNKNMKRRHTREEINNSKRRQMRTIKIKREKKLRLMIYEHFSLIAFASVYILN
jgi:phage protein D